MKTSTDFTTGGPESWLTTWRYNQQTRLGSWSLIFKQYTADVYECASYHGVIYTTQSLSLSVPAHILRLYYRYIYIYILYIYIYIHSITLICLKMGHPKIWWLINVNHHFPDQMGIWWIYIPQFQTHRACQCQDTLQLPHSTTVCAWLKT